MQKQVMCWFNVLSWESWCTGKEQREKTMKKVYDDCPQCEGFGQVFRGYVWVNRGLNRDGIIDEKYDECELCEGTGRAPENEEEDNV